MEIIVDGASNYQLEGAPKNVLAAVEAVSEHLQARGRAILSIAVDGEAITPETLTDKLEGKAVAETGRLEISSEAVAELVAECLREMDAVLPELPAACHKLAAVFHGENPEEGFEPFTDLAQIWGNIKERQLLVARALAMDLGALRVADRSVHELHEDLNGRLEEAAAALRDGDCVLLGDLLEYELAPRAEREAEIVTLLQSKAPAPSGG